MTFGHADRPRGARVRVTGLPIVVVGAGIIGSSIAYYLAQMGAANVTVVEASGVAQGSTGLASGGIRRQFPTREETELTLRTMELWRKFECDEAVDLGYQQVGYLLLVENPEVAAAVEARSRYQADLGVQVEFLEKGEVARRLPGAMTDDIVLSALSPEDGYADPADVTMAVMAAARRRGVHVRVGETVTGVATSDGRTVGVRTDQGDIPCEVVVDAAGLDAPALGAHVGATLPITPYRQHQFVTEPLGWLPDEIPCTQDAGLDLYIKKEGGGLLLGVASPAEAGSRSREVNWKLAEDLADKISHRWPSLEQAGLAHAWAGPYEVTPDGLPCIGQLKDPSGFVYAAGFNGHGFMHGLAAGEAVAELVLSGSTSSINLTPYDLARFGA